MTERGDRARSGRRRSRAKGDKKSAIRGGQKSHPRPDTHPAVNSPGVTLKDVAKVAGVSSQTVSYVINESGSVSDEMRARVRRIVSQMGYRPNRSAKAMRTGRSQTLGLIVSDIGHPFYAEFAQAVERAAATARYAVLLVDAQGPRAATDETINRIIGLQSHPVDGVISTVHLPPVLRLEVPVVLLGDTTSRRDSVAIDDIKGGEIIAEYLLQLGHRHFGLVTSPLPGGIPVRRAGLLDYLRDKATVVWEHVTPPTEKVTPEIEKILARGEASAVVCSNDIVAISVQRALWDLGIKVPNDVSVVGYDDITWSAIVTPALTTVRLPLAEMAQAAIQLIANRIDGPRRRARHLRFPVTVVERKSTGLPADKFAAHDSDVLA